MIDILLMLLRNAYEKELVGIILIYTNIVLGISLFMYEIREYMVIYKIVHWAWIKLAFAIIGIMWAVAYFVIMWLSEHDVSTFGAVVVRPLITITLSIMTAGAYWRRKSKGR
jgi:hypothetical protein